MRVYTFKVYRGGAPLWHVVELTDIAERPDGSLKYPRVVEKHGDSPDPEGWVEYLNSALVFPFEAKVWEYQDEGPLQMGDRFVVKKVVDEDDKYGVMVQRAIKLHRMSGPPEPLDLIWCTSSGRYGQAGISQVSAALRISSMVLWERIVCGLGNSGIGNQSPWAPRLVFLLEKELEFLFQVINFMGAHRL